VNIRGQLIHVAINRERFDPFSHNVNLHHYSDHKNTDKKVKFSELDSDLNII